MIAPLARFIDWSALQFWWALRIKSLRKWNTNAANSKLEEALQYLNGPDFLPAESDPARIEFTGPLHFRFPTPQPSDFEENNIVHGRFYGCVRGWQWRPTIVLLHGGGGFPDYHFRFPLIARRCNRAGFNAVTLLAPYHFQRRPRMLGDWNHLRIAKAFAQGVAEIRALTGWLLAEGCPSVALWGISLGGWSAGLAACCDARLAAVVLTVPGVRRDYKFSRAERVIWPRVREVLRSLNPAHEALNRTRLNLTCAKPVIPKENILLIEGLHDLFVENEATEELWQKWEQPEIWRLPHGHVIWMAKPGLTGRVLRWLAPRLNVSSP